MVEGCLAPDTSLRFTPDGRVAACCVNSRFPVGNVALGSVREIWEGARARELAEALGRGDFSLGCQECGADIADGHRERSYAPTFDRHAASRDPRWPRRIELAISNRCNLMCVQCTGELSSAIRSRRDHLPPLPEVYGEAFFEQIEPFLAHAEVVVFLGGEPFLQPECRRIWDLLLDLPADRRPAVEVTTNGTIWNERVERYVRELSMTVAVSVDAISQDVGEAIRVGSDHAAVLANVRRLREVTRTTRAGFGINACIMRENHGELLDLLLLGDELDADVEVILITYPRDRSLLLAPSEELDAAIVALEASDPAAQARLGRNRHRWDRVLLGLRDHAAGSSAVPVDISAAPRSSDRAAFTPAQLDAMDPRPTTVAAELELEAVELAARTMGEVARFHAVDGTIVEMSEPAWATDVGLVGCVGTPVDGLLARVAGRLAGEPVVDVSGCRTTLVRAETRVGDRRIVVVAGEWERFGERHLDAIVGRLVGIGGPA